MQPIFETQRLSIRPYTIADFQHFYSLNSDEDIMRYIRPAQDLQGSKDFFEKILTDYEERPGLGRWGMFSKDGNIFVGSFAVIPVHDTDDIQLGYALLKENWGKGYASESVKGGLKYAFESLNLSSIAGITEAGNLASQRVLLKAGFVFEKTFREGEKELLQYRYTPGFQNQRTG